MGKPAARISDFHSCPMINPGGIPHVGGPIIQGEISIVIGGQPAAVVGSMCTCSGPPDTILKGSKTVLFAGKPAARQGDPTAHGGTILTGFPSVIIAD